MRKNQLFAFGASLSTIGALGMYVTNGATMLSPFVILITGLFSLSVGGEEYRVR